MRRLVYLIVPTLVGWAAGSATCLSASSLLQHRSPSFEEFVLLARTAGILIVAPTYLFFVLPFSILALRLPRTDRARFAWLPMIAFVFFVGGLGTYFYLVADHLVEHVNFHANDPVRNPLLHLLPFIPYSLLVVCIAARMVPWVRRA